MTEYKNWPISEFAINVYHASANDTDFHTKNPTAKVVPGSHQHTNVKSSMKLSANDNILFSWFLHEEKIEGTLLISFILKTRRQTQKPKEEDSLNLESL